MKLKGGPELRARLASIAASKPELGRAWALDAAARIKAEAPTRTGRLRGSIQPGEKSGKAVVKGNWYGVILDRGTKAYRIVPRQKQALRFQYRGRTIFARQANRRRLRRRPFITNGAQEALRSAAFAGQIIAAWNRKRASARFSRL